ncbi:MAG TPA: hypothetical protein VIP11_18725 [Gemmatimonadaceae bacterium]
MFEIPHVRTAVSALIVSAALSSPSAAQTVAEYTRRVDSLGAAWRAAALKPPPLASEGPRVGTLADTVREGHFVVLVDSNLADLARRAAAIVNPKLDRAYGVAAAGLRMHTFVLRRKIGSTDSTQLVSGIQGRNGELRFASGEVRESRALAGSWQAKAEELITQDLEPSVREWVGAPVPSEPATERIIANGRVHLVLAGARSASDCANGRLDRCAQALGLVATSDPIKTLYDETEQRGMIERYAHVLRKMDEPKYGRCINENRQATCDSLLRAIPVGAITTSVPAVVRQNFLHYALFIGGDGAFDRLSAAKGTVSDRIAAAARVPTDSVIHGWYETLMHSPSSSTAINMTTVVSSIFWALLCGALSLRSSRWR